MYSHLRSSWQHSSFVVEDVVESQLEIFTQLRGAGDGVGPGVAPHQVVCAQSVSIISRPDVRDESVLLGEM